MQCIKCGNKNPGSVLYCQKCGEKMDMTAEEVQLFYNQKIREERRASMRRNSFRFLVFSIIFFLLAITFRGLAGGDPPVTNHTPSAFFKGESLRYHYAVVPKLNALLIPPVRK